MIWLEALSYVVTALGLFTAILVILRENKESELHRQAVRGIR